MSDLQDLPLVDQAMVRVQALEGLLEEEFGALKVQDLDQFERLLNQKNDLLHELTQLTGVVKPEDSDALGQEWDDFRARMAGCRDLHRRNEILILRKLDAIRGALDSLQLGGSGSSVETYDRLGQVRRGRRQRDHQAA
ncbi:MAG: hypothetical protein EBV20_03655 [Betaproteobacteria bacterium]|jgi:flagellar biosynthesis/type III secretory pathway chaperone|nr:hypothetical protein [Betaproteobacteria bacterium]NBP43642.1 hypothetical protein [Betaproteobacteria bacterium]